MAIISPKTKHRLARKRLAKYGMSSIIFREGNRHLVVFCRKQTRDISVGQFVHRSVYYKRICEFLNDDTVITPLYSRWINKIHLKIAEVLKYQADQDAAKQKHIDSVTEDYAGEIVDVLKREAGERIRVSMAGSSKQ